jgi:pimeloyl-ACP methyl ester carboxylesterase
VNSSTITPFSRTIDFIAGQQGSTLLVVGTVPKANPLGICVVIVPGGETIHRNHLTATLTQELSALGFHTARFDWHGIGDSTVETTGFDLNSPFVEDLLGLQAWSDQMGVSRLMLVGHCFGSRTALLAAPSMERVEAMFLISLPIRSRAPQTRAARMARAWSITQAIRLALRPSVIRRIRQRRWRHMAASYCREKVRLGIRGLRLPRGAPGPPQDSLDWIGAETIEAATELTRRGVSIDILFGQDDTYFKEWEEAVSQGVAAAFDRVSLTTIPGEAHGFHDAAVQALILERVLAWARSQAEEARTARLPRAQAEMNG